MHRATNWHELLEVFGSCYSTEDFLGQFVRVLEETFEATNVTIWLEPEGAGRFHQVLPLGSELETELLDPRHPVIFDLHSKKRLLKLDQNYQNEHPQVEGFIQATQSVLCLPLQGTSGPLWGFVTLGPRRQGKAYEEDEANFLGEMVHLASMFLVQVQRTESQIAMVQRSAIRKFSDYCLHDLKNIASGLSLVVQNAEVYGHDAEFQSSALRTIADTAKQVESLLAKIADHAATSSLELAPSRSANGKKTL